MNYTMTTPCAQCPFLDTLPMRVAFSKKRLSQFASNQFPCHKTAEEADTDEGTVYQAKSDSVHCAGALIHNERRNNPHQMMRIAERLGMYDRSKLNMEANVR